MWIKTRKRRSKLLVGFLSHCTQDFAFPGIQDHFSCDFACQWICQSIGLIDWSWQNAFRRYVGLSVDSCRTSYVVTIYLINLWTECWHLLRASFSSWFPAAGPLGPTSLQEFEPEVLFLAFGFDGMEAFEQPREDPASYRKKIHDAIYVISNLNLRELLKVRWMLRTVL